MHFSSLSLPFIACKLLCIPLSQSGKDVDIHAYDIIILLFKMTEITVNPPANK